MGDNDNFSLKFESEVDSPNKAAEKIARRLKMFKKIIKSFKQKAPSWSDITKVNIRKAPHNITLGINNVFNASLNTGYFPDLLNLAKLIFITKPKKPSNLITNFRPMSLLIIIDKIFEQILMKGGETHIIRNILYN